VLYAKIPSLSISTSGKSGTYKSPLLIMVSSLSTPLILILNGVSEKI
jgi:hypothetical protein